MRRAVLVAVLSAVAALTAVPTASAGIWTPIASGTTSGIQAIDYQAADRFWYATAGGQLAYRNAGGTFVTTLSVPGVVFNDIAFQPGGAVGIAVGNGGRVYRSIDAGVNWSQITPTTNANDECASPGSVVAEPLGDVYAVSWGAGGVVYLGGDKRTVLRSQDAGASFTEVNKTASGCRLGGSGSGPSSVDISDIQVIDASTGRANEIVYFQGRQAFGPFFVSGDGLQSEAAFKPGGPNGTQTNTNFVADPTSPNRVWSTNQCGFSCFVRSSDAMSSTDCVCTVIDAPTNQTDHHDIAYAGGTVLAVGDAGMIEQSTDGRTFYANPADAPNGFRAWRAVDLYDGAHAAVGAADGTLVVSDRANAIPDVVAPTGTISGPARVVAGQPATFTANVADEAGGSGINPASFAWSATGLPGASGNPVGLTFPSAGFYLLKVTFTDNAGNAGEATFAVTASAPVTTQPAPGPGTPTARPSATRTKTVTVAGGTVTLGAPRACVPAGTSFTATLSFKKSRRKGAKFVKVSRVDFFIDDKRRKIDRKAPFRQRLTVKALRAGSRHTLKARATIKVTRGRSPKKSISTTFTVCR